MTCIPIADAYLEGVCNAETPSGCLDANAECKKSICQCVVEFSDINGTCKAGKGPITDTENILPLLLYCVLLVASRMSYSRE